MHHKELSQQQIVELASAFYGSAVLFAALDHHIFTHISNLGEKATVRNIAGNIGASERGTRLLLDGCVAVGILCKDNDVYSNTDAGELSLVEGSKMDLSRAILYNSDVYPAWGKLNEFVTTGSPVESPELHLGEDDERTRRFVLSMHGRAMAIGQAVVPMLDLSGCRRLLDLAGGPGTYATLIAKANPEIHCVTIDLPAVSKVAVECVADSGVADRVECRSGDYHTDTYPAESFDAATIFGALHQESPAQIVSILKRVNTALKPGGKLFVLDMMTDHTHTSPAFSALFAINMALTTNNGWVFSDREMKEWMEEAGFSPGETRHMPPPMPHWLVTAIKK
ncbi:MAG: methyltransferase domain-containing protein [Lentisphaerae bacterium]|jgi:ubiquinone/menaquinone biosynthesis C-methylase UbiE|nr:methyltransferase domain-containing protein [Lentisphaerota bacterium]